MNAASATTSRQLIHYSVFLAMLLALPWPIYIIVVVTLSPIALALLRTDPVSAVLVLPQAALGAYLMFRASGAVATRIDASGRRVLGAAAALGLVFVVSWLPIFSLGANVFGTRRLQNVYMDYGQFLAAASGKPSCLAMGLPADDPFCIKMEKERAEAAAAYERQTRVVPGSTERVLDTPSVMIPAQAPQPIAPPK